MKPTHLLILFILLATSTNAQLNVKKLTSKIAIDGKLDEEFWDISSEISTKIGYTNNSAQFGLLWNEDYLFIGVIVTDENLCNNRRQVFYDDGIEICIDGHDDSNTSFDNNDLQLGKAVKSYWIQEMNHKYDGIKDKYFETESGYTMEFAIPWNTLNTVPIAGNIVGFNIVVNDDDDINNLYNLPGQLIWNGNSEYYKNPQSWGSIQLSSETTGFNTNYLSLQQPAAGDFLIGNETINIKWVSHNIENVKIEYSDNNGNSWNTIVEQTDANSGNFQWTTPDQQTNLIFKISDTETTTKDISEQIINLGALNPVSPLITAQWQNYQWPLNAYYPNDPNSNNKIGNPCGPSSLARIIHTWKYPRVGNGQLSFTDFSGANWAANFKETVYNYDNMPDNLSPSSLEKEYKDVATLFYHTAVSMEDKYGTGTDLENMASAMKNYFRYKEATIKYRHDFTRAEWQALLMNEIDNGRSVLVQAMNQDYFGDWHTRNGIGGHWYHCDGYNAKGEFHVIIGFGNYQYDGYYDIDNFPLYPFNLGILTGLEPDLNGKEIELIAPNNGENYSSGEQIEIKWETKNISNIQIEYTTDNGKTWQNISTSYNASEKSFRWDSPSISSNECKIRITDTENINVYGVSKNSFTISPFEIELLSPNGGEYFVAGDTTLITWSDTPIENISIYYSTDNGNEWTEIANIISADLSEYKWLVPNTTSSNCLIKITGQENQEVFDLSDNTFEIGIENLKGGPYKTDENTMVLIHGEGNYLNQSAYSANALVNGNGISFLINSIPNLGKCIRINQSDNASFLSIPHTNALNLNEDWTLELWIKPVSYKTGLQYLINKPGDNDEYFSNYALQMNGYWGNELFCFYFSGSNRIGINKGFFPELNKWYHVSFIRNTANSIFEVKVHNSEWEQIHSTVLNDNGSSPLISSKDLQIGFNFDGYIDEVRLSNVVRIYEHTLDVTGKPTNALETSGGIFNVDIKSNTTWQIESSCDWLTFDINEEIGNKQIQVNYSENNTGEDRSCNITISTGEKSKQFLIEQNGTITSSNNMRSNSDKIKLFPNPAKQILFIEAQNSILKDAKISILSSAGVVLRNVNHYPVNGSVMELDVKNLPTGVYFVMLQNRNDVFTEKVIIKN